MRTKIKPKLAPHDMTQRLMLNEQRVDTIAAMTQTIEEYCEAVEELNTRRKGATWLRGTSEGWR